MYEVFEKTPNGDTVPMTVESGQMPFSAFVEAMETGEDVDKDVTVILPLNDFIINTKTYGQAMHYYEELQAKGGTK